MPNKTVLVDGKIVQLQRKTLQVPTEIIGTSGETDTISTIVDTDGSIKSEIKPASITEDYLSDSVMQKLPKVKTKPRKLLLKGIKEIPEKASQIVLLPVSQIMYEYSCILFKTAKRGRSNKYGGNVTASSIIKRRKYPTKLISLTKDFTLETLLEELGFIGLPNFTFDFDHVTNEKGNAYLRPFPTKEMNGGSKSTPRNIVFTITFKADAQTLEEPSIIETIAEKALNNGMIGANKESSGLEPNAYIRRDKARFIYKVTDAQNGYMNFYFRMGVGKRVELGNGPLQGVRYEIEDIINVSVRIDCKTDMEDENAIAGTMKIILGSVIEI